MEAKSITPFDAALVSLGPCVVQEMSAILYLEAVFGVVRECECVYLSDVDNDCLCVRG